MMKHRRMALSIVAGFTLSTLGCANEESHSESAELSGTLESQDAPLSERLNAIDRDLAEGTVGEDVSAVQEYLSRYGYLPNAELARSYPQWRPIVPKAPAEDGVFDAQTTAAVYEFQRRAGLEQTGVVNGETLAMLGAQRCSRPEGILPPDERNKWAVDSKWDHSALSWSLDANSGTDDGLTRQQVRQAIAAAFAQWTANTSLLATEVSGTADIQIKFADMNDLDVLAESQLPGSPGGNGRVDMTINTEHAWSVATSTPVAKWDLMSTVLHELGHALGLDHSSVNTPVTPVMYWQANVGQKRSLTGDDRVAISTLYDTWVSDPAKLHEIAIAQTSISSAVVVWGLGLNNVSGGHGIWRKNTSTGVWTEIGGGAKRIAVGPNGRAWVINSVNQIFEYSTAGAWVMKSGLGKDIAAGADGSVWLIGMDNGIYKWNGSSWTKTNDGGSGVRIAVGPDGNPWVMNSVGDVYRRSTNVTASGSWVNKVESGVNTNATDLAVGPNGDAWITGTAMFDGGHELWVWNEQAANSGSGSSGSSTPSRKRWVRVQGNAMKIAAGVNGLWVVNSNRDVYRQKK